MLKAMTTQHGGKYKAFHIFFSLSITNTLPALSMVISIMSSSLLLRIQFLTLFICHAAFLKVGLNYLAVGYNNGCYAVIRR